MKCRWPMMDSYGGIILMQPSFRIHSSLKLLPTIPCLNFPPDLRRTFHRYLSSHPPLGPFQSISLVQSLASGVTWPQCLLLLAHPPPPITPRRCTAHLSLHLHHLLSHFSSIFSVRVFSTKHPSSSGLQASDLPPNKIIILIILIIVMFNT